MLIRTFGADRAGPGPIWRWRPDGHAAAGNLHHVVFDRDDPGATPPLAEGAIVVNIERRGDACRIRCFEQGREIRFCGSGVLAAIASMGPVELPTALMHGDRSFAPRWRAGLPGFALQPGPWHRCRTLRQWRHLTGVEPLNIRAQTGYVVVEVNDHETVAKARPRLAQFHLLTPRALILTARGYRGCDYVMRYFAPQYGKPEDAATGSANALLMRYWAQKLKRRRLTGHQLSATGGHFTGVCDGPWVTLYGQAEKLSA